MNHILRLLLLLISFSCTTDIFAADNLEWLQKDYDFGTFKELEGKKTGIVKFINRGDSPTLITRVRTSCGCTGAEYREGLIAPGDTAWVSFTYDPTGRPGRFEKTVKVYTGADNDLTSITIRGTVIGEPASLMKLYPVDAGELRLSGDFTNLGDVKSGQGRHFFLNGYNTTTDTLRPRIIALPESFSFAMSPTEVPPGDLVTFSIYYDASKEKTLGEHEYSFRVLPDEKSSTATDFRVKVTLHPDAAANAYSLKGEEPRATLSTELIDLGKTAASGKAPFEFSIKNSGDAPLIINRIYCPAGAVVIKSHPSKLKPGKSGKVKGYVNLSEIETPGFGLRLDVITNDADRPERSVRISGMRQ